jgi:hypothetical protein
VQRYLTCWCEESLDSNEQVAAPDQEAKANRCLSFEQLVHFLDLLVAWADLINSSIGEWPHEPIHHSILAAHWPLASLFVASLHLYVNNHNLPLPDIAQTSGAPAILLVLVVMVLLCYAYN